MGLAYAGVNFQIREVVLKNKPREMLTASPKGTVPVLLHGELPMLEESLEILEWSISKNDPDGWKDYPDETLALMETLIDENDHVFKEHLDRYKYSDRFPGHSRDDYRTAAESFLLRLEMLLTDSAFLFGDKISYADVAIFPFVRQFSNVEPLWFARAPYPCLRKWLTSFLESELFTSIMKKYPPWKVDDPVRHFHQGIG